MSKTSFRFLPAFSLAAMLLLAGCTTVFEAASEFYTDKWGSRSWAQKANLGGGRVEEIIERTLAEGTLRGRFNGLTQCVQTIYRMPIPNYSNYVLCEAIMPPNWNGKLLVMGCEGPGGNYPKDAPQFAKNGTMVVSCDGGMNFVRNRDGSPNAVLAGFQRPEAREAFMQEAVHQAIVGGRELAKAFYNKPVEKTVFFGGEVGGAQGVFLAERHPEDVDELLLVNPAIEFWPAFLYEFNLASHVRESSGYLILRESQCEAIRNATLEAAAEKQKKLEEEEFFALAAKYDTVFAFSYKSDKVRRMWHELFTAQSLSAATKEKVATVAPGVDMRPVVTATPWRVQWFFGDNQYGHSVPPAKLLASRELCDKLTPVGDLAAFAARGGKLQVVLEANNAFVPAAVAEAGLKRIKGVKPTIKRVETFSRH